MSDTPSRAGWLLLGSLYTTQYLGLGFLVVALAAILREQGASLDEVSLVYMLGMVWPLKFLWAPLVDQLRFGRWGHYRVWLLLMQGGLILVPLVMGQFHVTDDFTVIYGLGLCLALLSATQDIALDGLACRILSPTVRGWGNGLQVSGNLLGNMLGGGLVLLTYPVLGWSTAMALLAGVTAISFVQLLWYREPEAAARTGSRASLLRSIGGLWTQSGGPRWLLLVILVPVGGGLAYGVLTPILVDAGWSMERIGFSMNVVGSLAGMGAAMAMAWLLHRWSRRRSMAAAALFQIPGLAAIALPVLGLTDDTSVTVAVVLYFLCYHPLATVMATVMMDRASARQPATDYTAQYSLNMLCAIAAMSLAATLAERFGYGPVIALAVVVAVVAMLLSLSYRTVPEEAPTAPSAGPEPDSDAEATPAWAGADGPSP